MTQPRSPSGGPQQQPTKGSRRSKLWTLRDPEMLTLVFQIFEDLIILRERCRQKLAQAKQLELMFGRLSWEEDEFGVRLWSHLFETVTTSWSLLDHTVRTNRLDPAQFQEVYRRMLQVGTTWARLESRSGAISLIDQITAHLRQLLISHAQASTE